MPTPVEICNLSLSHLGVGKEIATLTEDSQEARACNRFFPIAVQTVLRDFPYPFANKFAAAQLVQEDPNEEWGFSYRYPSDCLKLIRILSGVRNDNRQTRTPYKIGHDSAGRLIYTDKRDAQLEYIENITDTSKFPPDASMALSFRLAAYVAPRLTAGDPFKMGERALRFYLGEVAMARANAVNEQQDEELPDSEFIRARGDGTPSTTGQDATEFSWPAWP